MWSHHLANAAARRAIPLVRLGDDALAPLGLPSGSLVDVARSREPRNGDLVWVELVLAQDRARLVRRYEERDGLVTLTAPGSGELAITYPRYEVLVLGVAEPASAAGCHPDRPGTPYAPSWDLWRAPGLDHEPGRRAPDLALEKEKRP